LQELSADTPVEAVITASSGKIDNIFELPVGTHITLSSVINPSHLAKPNNA
jgi:hypothetical protein